LITYVKPYAGIVKLIISINDPQEAKDSPQKTTEKTEEIAAVPKPNATVNKRTASRDFCISSSNFLLLFLPIRFDILGTNTVLKAVAKFFAINAFVAFS